MNRARCALLGWLLCPLPILAEMDPTEYQSADSTPTTAERERIRAEVEAEREAARQREMTEQAERDAALRRRQTLETTQPYPQRLHRRRCLGCHAPEVLAQTRHTWPGWYLTIARMRWFNGAVMTSEEARVINGYLAQQQPLQGWQRLAEYGLFALLPLTLLGLGYGGYHWYRRGSGRSHA